MTTQKVLQKIVQVTSNLSRLTKGLFLTKTKGMVAAMNENPTMVPTIDPTALVVGAEVEKLDKLHEDQTELEKNLKANTAAIITQERIIREMINVHWVPQVQDAAKGDIAFIKKLGFGIKGVDNGTSEKVVGLAADSNPIINKIETDAHMLHTVYAINSESTHKGVPKDAEALVLYVQVGGDTLPVDINKMTHLGNIKNGKLVVNFTQEQVGLIAYYICVYVNRKTGKTMVYSPVASAVIN